ncbi:MAG TPA: DUF4926 domain-containing protein, partial [Pseudonocardiaceae bacterium]
DVVVLRRGVPEHGIEPGARAAIIDVHTEPTLAYEVEVVDEETGKTVWWGPVEPEDIEPASDR